MTDELETDGAYDDKENQTNRSDNPSYQGRALRANFYAVAAPLHGYSQYRVYNNTAGAEGGNNKASADFASDSGEIGYIGGAHSTGSGTADNCVANPATQLWYSFITKPTAAPCASTDSTSWRPTITRTWSSTTIRKRSRTPTPT